MVYRNILLILTVLLLPDCYLLFRVVNFSLSDGMVPEKGRDISMTCNFEITSSDGVQTINILKGENKVADCILYVGGNLQCSKLAGVSARYTFTNSQPTVIVSITDLQISDAGNWYCGFKSTGNTRYSLQVYATPLSISLDGPPELKDLSTERVVLTCTTSNCVYPAPGNVLWYYKKENDLLPYQNLSTSPSKSCDENEKIYSSTLSLAKYKVWPLQPNNKDITVKFQCRLDFPTLMSPLVSADSQDVRYAVQVTSVYLSNGNRNLSSSEEIEIKRGSSKTFTCTTSFSRPAATIAWYIGSVVQQSSSSTEFRYTAKYEDNNKGLWCKAFNFQIEAKAVSSVKPSLNILVTVTSVVLTDGSTSPPTDDDKIKATENQLKTLTCTAGEANPAAIIMWYIGSDLKQNGTDKNLSFKPTNEDHDKRIFCKTYNTQPPDFIESAKPKLFVKVLATRPSLTNWTSGSPEFYSGEQVTLICKSTPTRPAVTLTWKKGTTTLQNVQSTTSENSVKLFTVMSTVTFIPEKDDNNKIISCETYITNETSQKVTKLIAVWWPPSTPFIPTNSFPWLEGQQGKSLTCQASDYGNPNANVTWTSIIGTPAHRELNFPVLIQDYNGENVSCHFSNKYTQKMNDRIHSAIIQLNIMYKPDVFIHVGDVERYSTERNEGESLIAICSAKGNPIPSVKWQGITPNNSKLEFTDIDRTDNGVYHCFGMATASSYPNYDFSNETSLNVRVNYAPNVTINLSDYDPVENEQLRISCVAVGRPNIYTYTSITQTWGGSTFNTHRLTNGTIKIDKLQLQDSGTYTCLVNNGIYDRNNQLDQMAEKNVLVKVSPKVLHVGENKFAGAVGTSVNITIPFYSYPAINSVEFRFDNDSEIINSDKHIIFYSKTTVEYMFYDQKVKLAGYVAMLYIIDEDESDFSNYTLVLNNGIGQPTEWSFKHVSESIPSPPARFNFDGLVNGVPTFTFIGGFNGGSDQTFIVETAIHGTENWIERIQFNENDNTFQTNELHTYSFNLTGLSPNKYDVRVLAENSHGRIEEIRAVSLEFTILSEGGQPSDPTTIIIISVCVAVAVLVATVLSVFVLRRRGFLKKAGSTTALSHQRQDNISDSSDDEVMTENQAYVSADDVVKPKTDNTYAQPMKRDKKKMQEKGDLYSKVNKTKAEGSKEIKTGKVKDEKSKADRKGKNKMRRNADVDNVYENASELTTVTCKGKETIYENPEESKPSKVVNRNKDGLIYADLTFKDQPKGQKKLVIHGLDSMTEYVEVDFTKRADPLPDSDEETTNP